MATYTKHTWIAREGVNLNRFTKSNETDSYVDLVNAPTSVSVAGTPFSITWMNEIESGILAACNFKDLFGSTTPGTFGLTLLSKATIAAAANALGGVTGASAVLTNTSNLNTVNITTTYDWFVPTEGSVYLVVVYNTVSANWNFGVLIRPNSAAAKYTEIIGGGSIAVSVVSGTLRITNGYGTSQSHILCAARVGNNG